MCVAEFLLLVFSVGMIRRQPVQMFVQGVCSRVSHGYHWRRRRKHANGGWYFGMANGHCGELEVIGIMVNRGA